MFFSLTTASDTVIISCDLSKRTCNMDKFEIIHVIKWHYDRRKTNFLKNFKYTGLHVLTSIELKDVRDILKDSGLKFQKMYYISFGINLVIDLHLQKRTFY